MMPSYSIIKKSHSAFCFPLQVFTASVKGVMPKSQMLQIAAVLATDATDIAGRIIQM